MKTLIFHMRPIRRQSCFEFNPTMDTVQLQTNDKKEMDEITNFYKKFEKRKVEQTDDYVTEEISNVLCVEYLVNQIGERTHLKFYRRVS